MAEHLFLCGLSTEQRKQYGPGPELQLHGPHANVRLRIDDLRRQLLEIEPELLADWLEIATYVFAADCAVSRGGRALKNLGERWRRAFHLVIAVRQPGSWNDPQRLYLLREALQFLTEDSWTFEFVELTNPPSFQQYLRFSDDGNVKLTPTTVVPFSGGLDSFAGAVTELSQGNGHVVLLSRQLGGLTDQRQRELADKLEVETPREDNTCTGARGFDARNKSARTHSTLTELLVGRFGRSGLLHGAIRSGSLLRERRHEHKPADRDAGCGHACIPFYPSKIPDASSTACPINP